MTFLTLLLIAIALCLVLFVVRPVERHWWLFGSVLFVFLYLLCLHIPLGG